MDTCARAEQLSWYFILTRVSRKKSWKYDLYRKLRELALEMNFTVDAVIVEGAHDHKTLLLLGYKGTILECSKSSHNNLVDLIAEKYSKVVILTDFDDQGLFINNKLSTLIEEKGIEVDHLYRRTFQSVLQEAQIYTIEGIYALQPLKDSKNM